MTAPTTHIPEDAARDIMKVIGMTATQASATLQLICLAENGETEWWNHYGYIERLHDGRGYTTTIFGACSGTGDLAMILDELALISPSHALLQYRGALAKCKGERVTGIEGMLKDVPKLNNDQAWQRAVWKVYIKLYWTFAANFAAKRGACSNRPGPILTTPLAKGFMVDTSINHGADMESFKPVLDKMQCRADADEATWLHAFLTARKRILKSGFEDLDTSKTGDRCRLWDRELQAGKVDLQMPIKAYDGYWGHDMIVR